MKLSELKNKISLSSKWSGIKIENRYIFEFLQTSIVIIDKEGYYQAKISSTDGYYSENYENLEEIKYFLDNNLDLI